MRKKRKKRGNGDKKEALMEFVCRKVQRPGRGGGHDKCPPCSPPGASLVKHDIPKKHIKIHLLGEILNSSRDIKITDCLETYLFKVLAVKHDISKNHVKIHVLRKISNA